MHVDYEDLRQGNGGQHFLELMRFQIARAEAFYEKSAGLEQRIAPDSRPTLIAMTEIYRGLLKKVAYQPEARPPRARLPLALLQAPHRLARLPRIACPQHLRYTLTRIRAFVGADPNVRPDRGAGFRSYPLSPRAPRERVGVRGNYERLTCPYLWCRFSNLHPLSA